jgi:predicted transcriptional regulator YheO
VRTGCLPALIYREMDQVKRKKCHPYLVPIIAIVETLSETLGPDYEVVLHDVSGEEHQIVAMAHGELTGRTEDSPLTDFGEYLLRSEEEYKGVHYIANYPSYASDGRPLRSSVTLLRDGNEKIIGFLCINYDMTRAQILKDLGTELTCVVPLKASQVAEETFVPSSGSLLQKILEEMRQQRGGRPLRYTTKREKLEIMSFLKSKGFFRLKGAVEALCKELGKSRYTVYGYLREIRTGDNDNNNEDSSQD